MVFRLKDTMYRDVTELATLFNELLDCTITDTEKMAKCLNITSLQGDEVKIAGITVSENKKTLEIVLNGLQDGEIIESGKWSFQLQDTPDPELHVSVENVTGGNIPSGLKITPYFLAKIDEEVFFSFFEL